MVLLVDKKYPDLRRDIFLDFSFRGNDKYLCC
jgi:hypothetical protein